MWGVCIKSHVEQEAKACEVEGRRVGDVYSFAPDPHLGVIMTIKEIQILEALIWRKCVHQCTRHLERVLDLHISLQPIKDTLQPYVNLNNMEASNTGFVHVLLWLSSNSSALSGSTAFDLIINTWWKVLKHTWEQTTWERDEGWRRQDDKREWTGPWRLLARVFDISPSWIKMENS